MEHLAPASPGTDIHSSVQNVAILSETVRTAVYNWKRSSVVLTKMEVQSSGLCCKKNVFREAVLPILKASIQPCLFRWIKSGCCSSTSGRRYDVALSGE